MKKEEEDGLSENNSNAGATRQILDELMNLAVGSEQDVLKMPIDKIRQELKKDRIDTSELLKFTRSQIQDAEVDVKMQAVQAKRELELRRREDGSYFKKLAVDVKDALENLSSPALSFQYRKLENNEDDDKKSLDDDINLLNHLEEKDD